MNSNSTGHALEARLRANLQVSGIPFVEDDIQQIIDRGYLQAIGAFEQLVAIGSSMQLPDYLRDTSPRDTTSAATDTPLTSSSGTGADHHYAGPVPTSLPWSGQPAQARRHASLTEVAELLRTRKVSSVEIVGETLQAIEAVDPELSAFQSTRGERALAAAARSDQRRASGEECGPLQGIPVAVKELFATNGEFTTAGSAILKDWKTDFDAAAVERMEQAGAVVVGKTRMSEFAYSPGSNNAHYGPTQNPWNREHDTGGSSSGSGAAVAAGLVYAALGTDTGGSIRIPGSLCGIVGLKPTHGRCSLYGGVTLSWSLDHVGPMTRTVHDAALVLQVLAGNDVRDSRTRKNSEWNYDPASVDQGVRGMRIGVVRDDGSGRELGTPEALRAWRAGLQSLEAAGAQLIELDLPQLERLRQVNSAILVLEAMAFHQPTLRTRLDDYGPFPRHRLLHAFGYGPLALVQAEQLRAALRHRMNALWEKVDLLSTPTMPYSAPALGNPAATTFTAPFNCLGWPAITVPVGLDPSGLPFGLQLIGKPWDESTVLRGARGVEINGPWQSR